MKRLFSALATRSIVATSIAATLLFVTSASSATLRTVVFELTAADLNEFDVNTPLSGSFSVVYDEDASPNFDANGFRNFGAISALLELDGLGGFAYESAFVSIRRDSPDARFPDEITVGGTTSVGGKFSAIQIRLQDSTRSTITGGTLTQLTDVAQSQNLSGFDAVSVPVFIEDQLDNPLLDGLGICQGECSGTFDVASVRLAGADQPDVAPIPLPASGILLIGGLVGLGAMRCRARA